MCKTTKEDVIYKQKVSEKEKEITRKEDIIWKQEELDEDTGIYSSGLIKDPYYNTDTFVQVGYNGIVKGDLVEYQGEVYCIVQVSRMGTFGLSKTGDLPYTEVVKPKEVKVIEKS